MNSTTRRLGLAAGATLLAAATGFVLAGDDAPTPFVVHEWGTFTSMQGADGAALEGLSREEEALPAFVYSRTKVRDCPLRDKGWKGLEVPAEHVTQKMETPVVYFHSTTRRNVRVRVDFMNGLLSQWYPVSDLLGPPERARDAGPLDVSKIEKSFLQWDVEVQPKGGKGRPTEVPTVAADDPWSFAREVNASWVRTLPRKTPERAGPVEAERYLFYRGLGAFPLPLSATIERGGKLTLRNAGDAAIASAIVLEVADGRGRIADAGGVAAKGVAGVAFADDGWGPIDDVEAKLRAAVGERLVKQGLHEDEARAMVRTWSRSWFKSEGARVIWIVPRATIDALLPLSIDPKPDDLVRVLVGRLELITPEQEDADYAALEASLFGDPAASERGVAAMKRRGRFVEPHLRRLIAVIDARKDAPRPRDAEIRGEAASWLAKVAAAENGAFGR